MDAIQELEGRMARPDQRLVDDLAGLDGDIMVLGAGGKLGPSLVRLALATLDLAGTSARVHAVSRFGDRRSADSLQEAGAVIHPCDVSDDEQLGSLPDVPNVVFLVGAKFGTTGREHSTWATNAYLPGRVAQRFRDSRIVALSTGNVYPLVPVGQGATEQTPVAPVGDYAMSCLGRERVLTNASITNETPMSIVRLNYAVEMRYGVLVDLASAVWRGDAIDLSMGYVNVVWQGYANRVILRCLSHCSIPPTVINLAGPETLSVRRLAEQFGQIMRREPLFASQEAPTALLSDASRCHQLFGYPDVSVADLVEQVADWVTAGHELLGKPTKFQQRDGAF